MKRIGLIVFPGFQILELAVIAAFELANMYAGKPVYTVDLLSEEGGMVRSSSGVSADTRRFGTRRATTHWAFAQELQKRHPGVKVQPDRIFINDGPVWTSAGMTAGIDLVLALLEEDMGVEAARHIAKKLVVYHRRPGGQSQYSALLELEPRSDRIQQALVHARANLRDALSVEELAEVANLSPRQFSRAFKSETGQSPAQAVENLRVEAARVLIDEGSLALAVVARDTGFGDPERMRRAFLRTLGQPPQSVRRTARQQAGEPAMA
jgi:transcriptional regulator GlxA family with amidase domain